jgi:hypothetical protein
MDREQQIRERAHQLWESEGRPEGQHEDHWARAKEELENIGMDAVPGESEAASGLSTSLQPGGTIPGAPPASVAGSIGTDDGSTADRDARTVGR